MGAAPLRDELLALTRGPGAVFAPPANMWRGRCVFITDDDASCCEVWRVASSGFTPREYMGTDSFDRRV